MKKQYLWLSALFLISPVFGAGMSYGVSPQGNCRGFSAGIPVGWKSVPSCSLVKPRTYGDSMSQVEQRRRRAFAATLARKKASQKGQATTKVNNTYARAGRARFTKDRKGVRHSSHRDKTAREKYRSSLSESRRNLPNYDNAKALELFKKTNLKREVFRQEGELTPKQKYQQRIQERGARRPFLQNATEMKREGFLKNEPNLFERREMRYKRELGQHKNAATHHAEIRRERRERLGPKEPLSVRLKRVFKGSRLEGDLDKRFLDD